MSVICSSKSFTDIESSDYYKLGFLAEQNGLISVAKQHFQATLKEISNNLLEEAESRKLKSTILERIDHLNRTFCPSGRSNDLNLSRLSVLDSNILAPFLHNQLRVLDLNSCPRITKNSITIIAEKCSELQKLFLNNCFNLVAIENGLIFKSSVFFKHLKKLNVSSCINLLTLRLNAPHLKSLIASNDTKLEILDLNAPLSLKIEAENTTIITIEKLEKLFGIEKLIKIAEHLDSNYCKFILKIFYPSIKHLVSNDSDITKITPGARLIKTLLDRIEDKDDFIKELQSVDSLSELKFTANEADKTTNYPMLFGMTLQFAYDPNKRTSESDFGAIKTHPIESTILLVAKALETNGVVSKLDFSSCMIGKSVGVLEFPFKNNYTITYLDLRNNNIQEELMFLAGGLKENKTLKYLNLRSNKIPPRAIRVLTNALNVNTSIQHLDLSENKLGGNASNAMCLGQTIKKNRSITHLYLSGNQFNALNVGMISSDLSHNISLEHLDLSANNFGFYGLSIILQKLEKNTALKRLILTSNEIECDNERRINYIKKLISQSALEILDLSENEIVKSKQDVLKKTLEDSKPGFKIKTTFDEFVDSTLKSLKEDESDIED